MSTLHRKTLPNGLRLQAIEMPNVRSVTTLILAGAGSRCETYDITGISHFLEHLFFKGAKKYQTPEAVAEAVDSFGGDFNAFTGKEYAGYYITSNGKNKEKAFDILSDMLLHSTFMEPEIDRERGVILQEMAMYQDMPRYQISWDFERLALGDQPLGWDQIGTPEVIKNVTRQQIIDYKNSVYVPENVVITVAGAVDANTLDTLAQYFQYGNEKQTAINKPFDADLPTEIINLRTKKTEQYHIALGARAYSENHPMYWASRVLATILGGNMSARMFQRIREQQGLCYSIHTHVDEYTDAGLICTSAGVAPDKAMHTIAAIAKEYDGIASADFTPEEFQKAKNYMLGKLDLRRDGAYNTAHQYGASELLYGTIETWDDIEQSITSVTHDQVAAAAAEIFQRQNLRLAGIGKALDEAAVLEVLRG